MSDAAIPEGYLTEQQVALLLDVKEQTLRTWAVRRKGPPRTVVGNRQLYRVKKFDQWLLSRETNFEAQREQSNRPRRQVRQSRTAAAV